MSVYLRDVSNTIIDREPIWVVCAKGDPGAVQFERAVPMSPETRASVSRVVAHVNQLRKYAAEWLRQAPAIAGGKHMIGLHPEASRLVAQAGKARQQAEDFAAILHAIPEPEMDS